VLTSFKVVKPLRVATDWLDGDKLRDGWQPVTRCTCYVPNHRHSIAMNTVWYLFLHLIANKNLELIYENAPKCTILKWKSQKFSDEGLWYELVVYHTTAGEYNFASGQQFPFVLARWRHIRVYLTASIRIRWSTAVFTALHLYKAVLAISEMSVRPSVRLSVCRSVCTSVKGVDCNKKG